MKASWKVFAVEVVGLFVMSMAISYIVGMCFDHGKPQLASADSTRLAMAIGAPTASVLLGMIGSFFFWRRGPIL